MNKLNRPIIKQQAKAFIKGKVFPLFVIILIVGLLTGSGGFSINSGINGSNIDNDYDNGYNIYGDDFYDDDIYGDDQYDFDDYYEDQQDGDYAENPFDSFGSEGDLSDQPFESFDNSGSDFSLGDIFSKAFNGFGAGVIAAIAGLGTLSVIIGIIFAPLQVTMEGIFVSLIRRRPDEPFNLGEEIKGLFKTSFNNTFGKKLALVLLRNIFTCLLAFLFIIPGIVYYYSTYFAFQLMCDNPDLSPMDALRLSKKMNTGNRSELFVLDLSFIPWYLLTGITLGIASIYVAPYVKTTGALFYENFRLRALAEGRIQQSEITPNQQGGFGYNQDNYFENAGSASNYYNNVNDGAGGGYYNPQSNADGYGQTDAYNPPSYTQPQADAQPTYYQPPQSNQGYGEPASPYSPPAYTQPPTEDGTQYSSGDNGAENINNENPYDTDSKE